MEDTVLVCAKNLIENIVTEKLKIKVVKNLIDEQNEKTKRTSCFVSILSADGSFVEKETKTIRINLNGKEYDYFIRGSRSIPIEIRVFGKNEAETDKILENILANLPRTWNIEDRYGTVEIISEHCNDYTSNYKDGVMQSAFVRFTMQIGYIKNEIKEIKNTKITGGYKNE